MVGNDDDDDDDCSEFGDDCEDNNRRFHRLPRSVMSSLKPVENASVMLCVFLLFY